MGVAPKVGHPFFKLFSLLTTVTASLTKLNQEHPLLSCFTALLNKFDSNNYFITIIRKRNKFKPQELWYKGLAILTNGRDDIKCLGFVVSVHKWPALYTHSSRVNELTYNLCSFSISNNHLFTLQAEQANSFTNIPSNCTTQRHINKGHTQLTESKYETEHFTSYFPFWINRTMHIPLTK